MAASSSAAKLVGVAGPLSGEVFLLVGEQVSVGRDAANSIGLADPALSRRHCEFRREADGWSVRDLASSNGTFVNGVQVTIHALDEGDRIALGESTFLFVRPASVSADVEFQDGCELAVTRTLGLDETAYLDAHGSAPRTGPRLEDRLRALLNISEVIHSIRGEEDLQRELLNLLFEALPVEQGAVLAVAAGGEVSVAFARSAPEAGAASVSRMVVRQALADNRTILISDATSRERVQASERLASANPNAVLCAPLTIGPRRLGALYLASTIGGTFTEDDLQLVTAVARIASVALENVKHVRMLEREAERLQADLHGAHNMVGETSAIQRVHERLARVARADSTVLIMGETGTGKELAARAIHLNSARARRPFVAINCAALTESLLESELFGHERGAFTGAVAQKRGRLETADGGTLFLDEVGELAPGLQSKLLRVLQEREFERVGGTRAIKVDIRVLSATNRDLEKEVAAGRFRADLYFRLNVVSIHMPPLRERRDDIPLLSRHFLNQYARHAGRRVGDISPPALAALVAYGWPGNIRELENAIERAVVLGSTEDLLLDDLPEPIVEAAVRPVMVHGSAPDLHAAVLDTKREAIVAAFRQAGGNYTETARALGVHPNYLHRLIRNLDLKATLEATR